MLLLLLEVLDFRAAKWLEYLKWPKNQQNNIPNQFREFNINLYAWAQIELDFIYTYNISHNVDLITNVYNWKIDEHLKMK